VLRRAVGLLVEPGPVGGRAAAAPLEIVVTGLSPGAGATTMCRGLAIVLRRRHCLEVTEVGASGAVAAGPGTVVLRDVGPADLGPLRRPRPGRVLVAAADGRRAPAVAVLVADVLTGRDGHVVLVANRVSDTAAWLRHGAVCVPASRLGALLVRRGRLPPGAMGTGLEALAMRLDPGLRPDENGRDVAAQTATMTLKPP
jgi:hypothetical protein